MENYRKVYPQIVDNVFKQDILVSNQIKSYTYISGYDHATRTLFITSEKEYVKSLLLPNLILIKKAFEFITKRTVDHVAINNKIEYSDVKTLEDIVSKKANVSSDEAKLIINTIEKTFEDDIFIKKMYDKDPENIVMLSFINNKLGLSKKLAYHKGDHRWKEDRKNGLKKMVFVAGAKDLKTSSEKRKRLQRLQEQIRGLEVMQYKPANKKTKKLVEAIMKY